MNLGDPELEMIDPTPNVHALFMQFDKIFFWTNLASRAVVRWSKRMYSCAGICSYDRGGLCDIALSEPLLKLRPRKDLVETLLHEMIHAYLFITNRDRDRDGHGPNFKAHMFRINKAAGLNITIYHDFYEEVALYQTHWWRCNGPCQTKKPHFGIVRRSTNRAPGPSEYWWDSHSKYCGGTFVKIKEPEKKETSKGKKNTTTKQNGDISKFITSNIKTIKDIPSICDNNYPSKPILKDSSNVIAKPNTNSKTNSATLVDSKIGVIPIFTGKGHVLGANKVTEPKSLTGQLHAIRNGITSPSANKHKGVVSESPTKYSPSIPVFTGKGHILGSNSVNQNRISKTVGVSNPNKHKANPNNTPSPPAKMKKIDDYFKVQSLLTDLYGDSVKLVKSKNESNKTFIAVTEDLVNCPICDAKFSSDKINRHLDECLNTDIIEKLSKDSVDIVSVTNSNENVIPSFENKELNNNTVDLTNLKVEPTNTEKGKRKSESPATLQSSDLNLVNLLAKEIHQTEKPTDNRRKTISYITKDRGDSMTYQVEKDESNKVAKEMEIKSEPGTSREFNEQTCPCCGKRFSKPVEEHLDECPAFFDSTDTVPGESPSTSYSNNTTIVIDDDDICDESLILNATGTKTPCPCCMKMVEQADMNNHLDLCLQ